MNCCYGFVNFVTLLRFMPVGTKGSIKGVPPCTLKDLGCHVILGNTYHLGLTPGQVNGVLIG